MKIVGSGKNVIDSDLLARLATDKTSGGSISGKELQSTLKSVRSELKDQFDTSTRGLDRAALAVSNTLELAIKSGWVKAASTTKVIEEFLDGAKADGLKATLANIREDVKSSRTGGTSYGGYSPKPRRTYGGSTGGRTVRGTGT